MKPRMLRQTIRVCVTALLLSFAALASIVPSSAQTPADATPDAKAILMQMADYISKLPSFTVEARCNYDSVQKNGQKIEYEEVRTITVARPDRLRIDVVESDGDQQTLLINSKDISVTTEPANVFAQTPSPGNLDQAIVFFVRDLQMRLPFAPLLVSTAAAEIEQRTKTLDYVEKTTIFGQPAHHLAGRAYGVDFQVWITDGDKPLPLRLVFTYLEEKGEPQFRAQFSDWNVAPEVSDGMFIFNPPQGSHRIEFLAQLPRSVSPKPATTTKPGSSAKQGDKK